MVTLVIGGSGSGKSAYAEQLLAGYTDVKNKYYLATMLVYDQDGEEKVKRHRRLREGKGFLTLEQPRNIGGAVSKIEPQSAVLLECMSNLAANEMFGEPVSGAGETVEKITRDMRSLRERAVHLVIVTNNVFEDGIRCDDMTMEYIRALGEINRMLAREADAVVEVVVGLPLVLKASEELPMAGGSGREGTVCI